MKKIRFFAVLAAALLLAVSCTGMKPLAQNAGMDAPLEVTILHINDHHSHLEPVKIDMTIDGV